MTLGVVVPCLGQERFLPRTLAALERALAGREWRGALVLSAPDGAPPATGAAWRVLRARGPRPLTPGAARNRGLAACGGEGVLCVDADVELERAWLERALAALAADPALAGAGGRLDAWYTDGGGGRPGERDLNRTGDADANVPYLAAAALYRRAALERVGGFAEGLGSEEDFELGLRLARAGFRLRHLGTLAGRHWSAPRPSRGELARRW
ncbi:MAG TPA: glycosyltransferase family A protein, partial [Candidatus Eisenbacteria bacterium]|nr:glycosyltransferase family A protein [Candidatus Eisenbacteria bacterium]